MWSPWGFTYFARDPKYSWFHEHSRNWIYFLNNYCRYALIAKSDHRPCLFNPQGCSQRLYYAEANQKYGKLRDIWPSYFTFQMANNKGPDQTTQMHRLVCAFAFCKQQSQGFIEFHMMLKPRRPGLCHRPLYDLFEIWGQMTVWLPRKICLNILMSDLCQKVSGQPWPEVLIYSHCLIRLTISSKCNDGLKH